MWFLTRTAKRHVEEASAPLNLALCTGKREGVSLNRESTEVQLPHQLITGLQ